MLWRVEVDMSSWERISNVWGMTSWRQQIPKQCLGNAESAEATTPQAHKHCLGSRLAHVHIRLGNTPFDYC
jgi:hypothetical protein